MFCSGCGTEIQSGLNYCSRCGQRLAADSERAQVAESLSSSVGFVAGGGFISFIFVALVLVKNGVPGNQIIPIAFFYFAALFGICFLILRQTEFFSKKDKPSRTIEVADANPVQAYSAPATTARLKELREPAIESVIEETTRTLEEVHVGRK